MVYITPDDCKSELGKRMQYWRSERPDEWLMDEFIAGVEDMYEQIKVLETKLSCLQDSVDDVVYYAKRNQCSAPQCILDLVDNLGEEV